MSEPSTAWRDMSIALDGTNQRVFQDIGMNGCQERFLANPSAAGNVWVNVFGQLPVANGQGSLLLAPGGYLSLQSSGPVNVLGVAGQKLTAGER